MHHLEPTAPTAPVHRFVQGSRFAEGVIVPWESAGVVSGFELSIVLFETVFLLRKERVMSSLMWRERMHSDMVVAGLAERTREAYLRAVRMLSQYYNGDDPAQLTEQAAKDDREQHAVRKPPTQHCAPMRLCVRPCDSPGWPRKILSGRLRRKRSPPDRPAPPATRVTTPRPQHPQITSPSGSLPPRRICYQTGETKYPPRPLFSSSTARQAPSVARARGDLNPPTLCASAPLRETLRFKWVAPKHSNNAAHP